MKKVKMLGLMVLSLFLGSNVYAVCDVTESNTLNSLAVNVGANYEIITKEIAVDENYNLPDGMNEEMLEDYVPTRNYFRIYITNVTEELYVVVNNTTTNESKTYTFEDAVDGVITFDTDVYVNIMNYTIQIYSSSATNCPDTLLFTTYLTTPMYNMASDTGECEGIEEFYMCHEYLSVDVDFSHFYEYTEDYRNGLIGDNGEEIIPDNDDDGGFLKFLQDNIVVVVIVVVVIIAIGGLTTFVIIRRRRRIV